jgi:hypothetical protein
MPASADYVSLGISRQQILAGAEVKERPVLFLRDCGGDYQALYPNNDFGGNLNKSDRHLASSPC